MDEKPIKKGTEMYIAHHTFKMIFNCKFIRHLKQKDRCLVKRLVPRYDKKDKNKKVEVEERRSTKALFHTIKDAHESIINGFDDNINIMEEEIKESINEVEKKKAIDYHKELIQEKKEFIKTYRKYL